MAVRKEYRDSLKPQDEWLEVMDEGLRPVLLPQ